MSPDNDLLNNFLNDVTTALPYSNYIKANIGNYVIIDEKPYIIKGTKFTHSIDDLTMANGITIHCYIILENINESAHLSLSFGRTQVFGFMDNPMLLIDFINTTLRQKLKFISKNKTTDLLFQNEG